MGVREDLDSLVGKTVERVELVKATEAWNGAGILLAHIYIAGEPPAPWRNPVVIGLQQQNDYGYDEAFEGLDEDDDDEEEGDTNG